MHPDYNPISERPIEEGIASIKTWLPSIGDPVQDRQGMRLSMVKMDYRFVGIAQFVMYKDVNGFRENLKESVHLTLSLFARADKGEKIAGSYLSLLNYQEVLDAFAACEFELGIKLLECMGGEQPERKISHPFDNYFARALKAVVLEDAAGIEKWLPEFRKACSRRLEDFLPYVNIMRAIVDRNAASANEQFGPLIVGHHRESRGRGVFAMSDDCELCVWGIGIANLCRWRGLFVEATPPLIPEELLYHP